MNHSLSHLVIIFSCLFLTNTLQAQQINPDYASNSIYFKGTNYVKNGETYSAGLFQGKLAKEMEVSPDAVIEFNQFKRNRNASLILSTLAVGAALLAPRVNNADAQTVMVLGGAAAVIASIPLAFKAQNKLQKAVWLRNGVF